MLLPSSSGRGGAEKIREGPAVEEEAIVQSIYVARTKVRRYLYIVVVVVVVVIVVVVVVTTNIISRHDFYTTS